jgi:hypothetical protein
MLNCDSGFVTLEGYLDLERACGDEQVYVGFEGREIMRMEESGVRGKFKGREVYTCRLDVKHGRAHKPITTHYYKFKMNACAAVVPSTRLAKHVAHQQMLRISVLSRNSLY